MAKKKKKWKKKKRKKEEKKEEEKEQGEEEERALLTHLVAPHCSLCSCVRSTVLIYLLICSLTQSRAHGNVDKMSQRSGFVP